MNWKVEFGKDVFEDFFEGHVGIEDEDRLGLRVEILEQFVQQSRLARSRFADQGNEPLALRDPVVERRKRLPVSGIEIEKLRIGRHVEGAFGQLVEVTVH
ncbi:MAG: hypothetical protein ACHQ9S_13030 [Candidatus Binatia bacterium]